MSSGNGGEPGSDLLGTFVKKCSDALLSQSDIPFYTSHQKSRPATDSIRNWERQMTSSGSGGGGPGSDLLGIYTVRSIAAEY